MVNAHLSMLMMTFLVSIKIKTAIKILEGHTLVNLLEEQSLQVIIVLTELKGM